MFDSIGWGELLVIALAALFIFGPERLPNLARDAAAGLRRVRGAVHQFRGQVDEVFGEDLAALQAWRQPVPQPGALLRQHLLADPPDVPETGGGRLDPPPPFVPRQRTEPPDVSGTGGGGLNPPLPLVPIPPAVTRGDLTAPASIGTAWSASAYVPPFAPDRS